MAAILEKETKARCEALMDAKVQACFHEVLGTREGLYRDSFRKPIADLISQGFSDSSMLALVETRIPFAVQAQLLGIKRDPGIFYKVVNDRSREPYGVNLTVVRAHDVLIPGVDSYEKAMANLPPGLKPASPLEGISGEIEKILASSAVVLPGGEYEMPGILTGGSTRFNNLTLEKCSEGVRIGRQRLDELDYLLSILAART